MDAVQFGRWLADRRYISGWASQQALVDAIAAAHDVSDAGISRPFLARLEAGLLVHPFRGAARQRVLLLASFLCKTPRQVSSYLQLAEITHLRPEERVLVQRIIAGMKGRSTSAPKILPAKPRRLVGRDAVLEELLAGIEAASAGCFVITGMPGIGKSAVAAEALHRIAAKQARQPELFPDGIATFTCTGRHGVLGLVSLLDEVISTFAPNQRTRRPRREDVRAGLPLPHYANGAHTCAGNEPPISQNLENHTPEYALARAIDLARGVLAGKRPLLLLDDVEPDFPLRQLLSVLATAHTGADMPTREPGPLLLLTSRVLPIPALMDYHLHLTPLDPDAAAALLSALLSRPLPADENEAAARLCATVGYVPQAIEVLAAAIISRGIPLAWLAAQTTYSLRTILDEAEAEMRAALERAVAATAPAARRQFALLSVLDAPVFDLEAAGALYTAMARQDAVHIARFQAESTLPATHAADAGAVAVREDQSDDFQAASMIVPHPMALAETAATMDQLVRHSVVDALPASEAHMQAVGEHEHDLGPRIAYPRYAINPLFAALAAEQALALDVETLARAEHNLAAYALSFVNRYMGDVRLLEPMGAILLNAVLRAIQRGDDDAVVRLIDGLSMLLMRLPDERMGDRLFLHGIEAARRRGDLFHAAHFLNRLANLRYYHGSVESAERTWHESLQTAEALGRPGYTWVALYNLNLLARMRGDYVSATRFADTYYRTSDAADWAIGVASGLLQRGISSRLLGRPDQAYDDQQRAVRLLEAAGAKDMPGISRMLVMEASLEVARLEEDYPRTEQYLEEGITTAYETYDRYAAVELLLGQAEYALACGARDDAGALARRASVQSKRLRTPYFEQRANHLLQSLSAGSGVASRYA